MDCIDTSLSPLLVLLLLAFVTKKWINNIDNWILKKELFFAFTLLLFAGIFQFLLRDVIYENPLNWSYNYFFEEITNTLLAGILLAVLVISINLNIQFFKNTEKALSISDFIEHQRPQETHNLNILIPTEVKSDTFTLQINRFIFAKAEGNYIKIGLLNDDNSCICLLKRITLKEFGNIVTDIPHIMQVHRSFILNTHFIDKVNGNAQGYKIVLKNCTQIVLVSRNYLKVFNDSIEKIS